MCFIAQDISDFEHAPNLICFCLLLQYNSTLCIGYKDIRWSGDKTEVIVSYLCIKSEIECIVFLNNEVAVYLNSGGEMCNYDAEYLMTSRQRICGQQGDVCQASRLS